MSSVRWLEGRCVPEFPQACIFRIERSNARARVRFVFWDNRKWFVVADVCKAFDICIDRQGNPNVMLALREVEADEHMRARLEGSPGTFRPFTSYRLASSDGLRILATKCDADHFFDFLD